MQKCTDFPEASRYSVGLRREEKSVHQTEHKVIVMLCFISKSCFLSHPRIPHFTCFGNSAWIRVLPVYCSLFSTTCTGFGFDCSLFLELFFLPSNNSRAISSAHQWCHSVTTSSRSPRGDLTRKHKTNQTEQEGSGRKRKTSPATKKISSDNKKGAQKAPGRDKTRLPTP